MKKLIVMRHAKSDWSNPSLADIDRPLNRRGERDAPRMGRALAERNHIPDLLLLSPAERVNRTAEGLSKGMGRSIPGEFIDSFYPGNPADFREALEEYGEKAGCILVLAHNPGVENFVMQLSGRYHKMPTAAAAVFSAENGFWQLVEILRAKEL